MKKAGKSKLTKEKHIDIRKSYIQQIYDLMNNSLQSEKSPTHDFIDQYGLDDVCYLLIFIFIHTSLSNMCQAHLRTITIDR